MVAAIAAVLIGWGLRPFALLALLSASAYLRPGECRRLRAKDLLRRVDGSEKALKNFALSIAPEVLGVPTKTNTVDETLYLDYPVSCGWQP